jgi:hypothetical protein
VSPFHITTRYFIMPALPEKEKDEAIRYEASRFTHMKLTESVFGCSESSHVPNVLCVTANAAKRSVIKRTVMNLRRGFAEPEAIEPDYVPFSRASAALGFIDAKKAHAMIWFDSDGSVNVTLASRGIVFLAQDFRLSGDVEKDREKIRDELHGSLRFLIENAGGANVEYILIAGFGNLDEWEQFLSQSFPAVRSQVLRLPVQSEADQAQEGGALLLAFGLGLGELGVKSPLGELSLLPSDDKKLRSQYFGAILVFTTAAVFVLFFLVNFLVVSPIQRSVDQKKSRAEDPLLAYGPIAQSSMEDIEAQATQLASQVEQLEKFEKSRIPFKEVLTAAAQAMPPSMWLQRIHFESLPSRSKSTSFSEAMTNEGTVPRSSPRIILEGYCFINDADQETKQVNEWAQNLAKDTRFARYFGNIAVDEIKQQKVSGRNTTRFTVTAEA